MSEIRFTTLDEIVKDVIAEEGLDARSHGRMVRLAIRGWNRVFREATNEIKTIIMPFANQGIRIIDYPYDYDYYTKIGVIVHGRNGTKKIMTLSLNNYMYTPTNADIVAAQCTCDSTTLTDDLQAIQEGGSPFAYYSVFQNSFRGGQFVGELYGLGGGESAAGAFKCDDANSRFIFSNHISFDSQIVMEYKRIGTSEGSNTRIPLVATECMIAWVKWKRLNMANSSLNERMAAQRRFEEEEYQLYEIQESNTASEILDALYESSGFIRN